MPTSMSGMTLHACVASLARQTNHACTEHKKTTVENIQGVCSLRCWEGGIASLALRSYRNFFPSLPCPFPPAVKTARELNPVRMRREEGSGRRRQGETRVIKVRLIKCHQMAERPNYAN